MPGQPAGTGLVGRWVGGSLGCRQNPGVHCVLTYLFIPPAGGRPGPPRPAEESRDGGNAEKRGRRTDGKVGDHAASQSRRLRINLELHKKKKYYIKINRANLTVSCQDCFYLNQTWCLLADIEFHGFFRKRCTN